MEALGTQLYSFGIVLLAGVSLGFLFDVFRVFRGLLRPGLISTPLLDLLFWALFTPVLLLYLLLANWGELRGYVIIGLGLGFFFYRLILSNTVINVILWVVRVVSGILNLIITFLLWLISVPLLFVQQIRFFGWFKEAKSKRGFRARLRWRK